MKKDNLTGFLIKRFLMFLLFVSVSQGLLSLFYNSVVYPFLEDTLKISLLQTGKGAGETITMLGKSLQWFLIMGLASCVPRVLAEPLKHAADQWAGQGLAWQFTAQTSQMTGWEARFYTVGIGALFFLLMVLMLLPYIIAAAGFSHMVAKKVEELEQEKQQQRLEYEKRKNLLLSDVAHDLKTPMTAVSGYASMLAEGEITDDKKQKEYLDIIYEKSMAMSGLLNLLFDYVKLDSEGFVLKKEQEDITELLRESAASLYADFEEREMEFVIEIPEVPVYVLADRIQFQRVIWNLLNNALKHNPVGTSAGISLIDEEDEMIEIRVWDKGEIIPEETAEYLFEPFVMGDQSRNQKGGSGLGLSIAKKVIEMHGGTLSLEQGKSGKAFVMRMGAGDTDEGTAIARPLQRSNDCDSSTHS